VPEAPPVATSLADPRASGAQAGAAAAHALWQRVLRIPLLAKLLGANAIIALGALAAFAAWGDKEAFLLEWLVLAASLAANSVLVRVAMRPLDDVTSVAERVSEGDFSARVLPSAVADERMSRLGAVFNRLLDRVVADRLHIRELIGRSMHVREVERECMARELRDATAQQLYGLSLQLATAVSQSKDPDLTPTLATARDMALALVEDVRLFAESIYPALLGKFGLVPAVKMIARNAECRLPLLVTVDVDGCKAEIPPMLAAALYRVADECVSNVERHAGATTLRLVLSADQRTVRLVVEDDGAGFDVADAERSSPGVGLFRARQLLEHAGGTLSIESVPGGGTRVTAAATL